jgi:uncharacterized Fe-S cluster-containing protein
MTQHAELPGLDCGLCGFRKCDEFAARLDDHPEWIERCVHLSGALLRTEAKSEPAACGGGACAATCTATAQRLPTLEPHGAEVPWQDSLGRDFDFYLEHFPEEPGPRETILPHNPMITREMNIQPGEMLIGRPLGMSCGCPITHCGVAMDVDYRTGVINWCVTGPLRARSEGFRDLGYYSAEAYDGLIRKCRVDVRIGMRYFFQPRMCMLQWRHSGLVNYLNRTPEGLQVRLEGLWIG